MLSLLTSEHRADALSCPGKSGYALQQCLRDLRRAKQEAEGEETEVQEEVLKTRQYEQPGELVTLPSGIQYREMLEGNVGPPAEYGSVCEISYIVYRLASGAYFKYSSGGTPVFLFSLGYGNEGKDDVGSTYRFVLGEPDAVPAAVNVAMVGMRQGGRRRVLTPPGAGWNRPGRTVKPIPDTFGGRRRLETHKDEPLLFEVELRRVYPPGSLPDAEVPLGGVTVRLDRPFQLPAPPSPFRKLLGDAS